MGSNMARRLKECGFTVSAVFDAHRPLAEALAQELGTAAPATLAGVTAVSDVILTVVTDDKSMGRIFATRGDSLLVWVDATRIGIEFYDMDPQNFAALSALIEALSRSHR